MRIELRLPQSVVELVALTLVALPARGLPADLPDPLVSLAAPHVGPGEDVSRELGAARSMAARAVNGVESLASAISNNEKAIAQFDRSIASLTAHHENLEREARTVIAEYSRGEFCSGCSLTRTQIEAKGERFPHPNQHIVVPTQEQIYAKKAEYAAKLKRLLDEQDAAREARAAKMSECLVAWAQIQEGLNLWRTAVAFEFRLLANRESALQSREHGHVVGVQSKLAILQESLRKELAEVRPDVAKLNSLSQAVSVYEGLLANLARQGDLRYRDYLRSVASAEAGEKTQFLRIGEALRATNRFESYLGTLFQPLPAFKVSAGPVSVHSSPGQLGLEFRFGSIVDLGSARVPVSVEATGGLTVNTSPAVTEVSTFITMFLKTPVYEVSEAYGVGYSTSYGPGGVSSGFTNKAIPFKPAERLELDLTPPALASPPSTLPLP